MTHKLLFAALAIGSAMSLSAVPAMAAPPPPSFSFGIHIGDPPPPPPPRHIIIDEGDDCLSNREIFRGLSDLGYRRFEMVDHTDDGFVVDARRGIKWYELTVDDCTGDIIDRVRIRHD